MRVLIVGMLLLAGLVRAHAQANTADPTVGVIVMGEPTLQAPLASHVKAWLGAHGFTAVDAPFATDGQQKTFVDCFVIEDLKCAMASFANARADHVVFARVDLVAGEGREAALTAYWFSRKHDAVAEKRACKGCDDVTLRATTASLLDTLARASGADHSKVPPRLTGPRRGVFGRIAPALLIGIGGATMAGGATLLYYGGKGGPDEPYTYPGATAGGVGLTLAGAAAVIGGAVMWKKLGKREHSRYVPPALIAAGAAALIGGSIALSYGAKKGPDEPFVYDNATEIGGPFAIVGGGALIAGALMWIDDLRRER